MKSIPILALLLLTACAAQRPPAVMLKPLTRESSPAELSSVRCPETVRVYHIGRYTDPHNGMLMHERHAMYRVEGQAGWNLSPGPMEVLLLPFPSTNSAFSPVPVSGSILAEVNAQKLATLQMTAQTKMLSAYLAQFQTALQQTKTNLSETAALRMELVELRKRIESVETTSRGSSIPEVESPVALQPKPNSLP